MVIGVSGDRRRSDDAQAIRTRARMSHHHAIIIGSGPAGLTAAIYSARANLRPLVIEGEPSSTSDQPGGQLMLTTDVENFPGFPDGIMGPELMQKFREQSIRFGAEFLTEKVTSVDFSERPFKVNVRNTQYTADAVIVSTGAQSLMLGLESEARLLVRLVDVRPVTASSSVVTRSVSSVVATAPWRRRRSSPSSPTRSS
jgi:thioredoxin reductase